MDFVTGLLRLAVAIAIAFVAGKLISKLKLPSILGWLIAGMCIGPHALNLLNGSVLDSTWFDVSESVLECVFGLMIGTEMIWKEMKKAGDITEDDLKQAEKKIQDLTDKYVKNAEDCAQKKEKEIMAI